MGLDAKALEGTEKFGGLKSVAEMGKQKGECALPGERARRRSANHHSSAARLAGSAGYEDLGRGKRCFIFDVVDDCQRCVRVRVLDEIPLSRVPRRLARCTGHVDKHGRIGRAG